MPDPLLFLPLELCLLVIDYCHIEEEPLKILRLRLVGSSWNSFVLENVRIDCRLYVFVDKRSVTLGPVAVWRAERNISVDSVFYKKRSVFFHADKWLSFFTSRRLKKVVARERPETLWERFKRGLRYQVYEKDDVYATMIAPVMAKCVLLRDIQIATCFLATSEVLDLVVRLLSSKRERRVEYVRLSLLLKTELLPFVNLLITLPAVQETKDFSYQIRSTDGTYNCIDPLLPHIPNYSNMKTLRMICEDIIDPEVYKGLFKSVTESISVEMFYLHGSEALSDYDLQEMHIFFLKIVLKNPKKFTYKFILQNDNLHEIGPRILNENLGFVDTNIPLSHQTEPDRCECIKKDLGILSATPDFECLQLKKIAFEEE
ncbi:hypothetical protein QR680_012340 [Steinernema hermaphroditum]|uniref:Uncharacterized protein n=1 Tax=Steinernema hermaphroditum TaxID=289476 RepID=A0AA39I3C5_9BILA|nr:hypothetical protein QR680_012340 [Steinernema hermaphroditum]